MFWTEYICESEMFYFYFLFIWLTFLPKDTLSLLQAHLTLYNYCCLFHCHLCIIQLMWIIDIFFHCDTQKGIICLFSFISKRERQNDIGLKVLIQQSYFMEDNALSPFCDWDVDVKSWLVLLIWGWVRPICHLVRRGRKRYIF